MVYPSFKTENLQPIAKCDNITRNYAQVELFLRHVILQKTRRFSYEME